MKKIMKYSLGVLTILALVYFSLDIQNLDEYKAANPDPKFDAVEFASQFWDNQLSDCVNDAPDVNEVLPQLELNPNLIFDKHAHKLGISNTYYLILNGSGLIEAVEEEHLLVRTDEDYTIQVATDFIFGNAIRDGSGKVDINQFINMTDFNNISVALNTLAKEQVVSRLRHSAKAGMRIDFTGATELAEDNVYLNNIRVIPIAANLIEE